MKACQFDRYPGPSAGAWLLPCLGIFKVARDIDGTDHLLYDTPMRGPIRDTRRASSGRNTGFHAIRKQRAFVLRTKPTYRW